MKTIYLHINECYGGSCWELKREYSSPEEFIQDLNKLKNLSQKELDLLHDGRNPLQGCCPALYEIELHEDEEYIIDDYDGWESIQIRLKNGYKSNVSCVDIDWCQEEEESHLDAYKNLTLYRVKINGKIVEKFTSRPEYLDEALEEIALKSNKSVWELKRKCLIECVF